MGLPGCGGASAVEPNAYAVFPHGCGAHSIVALMAGACAEQLVLGAYDNVGVTDDWRLVTALMDGMGVSDGGEALWTYTNELLVLYEDLIVRVAAELMHARSLDGGEIDALLAQ